MAYVIPELDEFISSLPSDPYEAFIEFEDKVRKATVADVSPPVPEDCRTYCAYMHGYILGADTLPGFDMEELNEKDDSEVVEYFQEFTSCVMTTIIEQKTKSTIKHNNSPNLKYKIEASTKIEIRHHVYQIKALIDEAEITEFKKTALMKEINRFLAEVDKDKAWQEHWGNILVMVSNEFKDNVEWAVTIAERWQKISSKLEKSIDYLPGPKGCESIEPPRQQLPSPQEEDLDETV